MKKTEMAPVKVILMQPATEEPFKGSTLPMHSKLYGLAPCELGTVWTESLTSYLNRLADLHHVSPQHLVAQEIVPHLNQSYSRQHLSVFSWSTAMSVNGNGPLAQEWTNILEGLTRRSDLCSLTLQGWIGDLPPHKLLREKPAWCPVCYAEWKEQEMPIYEPLLWVFPPVTMCPKHLCQLAEYCPDCGKRQSFIRGQIALDQCVRCKTWLGSSIPPLMSPNPEIIEWQKWVIHALDELHSAAAVSLLPSWEQFFTNLGRSCEKRGEQSRLAELAGLARGQLATWLRRSHTPTLGSILEFCYVCNVTPLQIFLGDLAPLRHVINEGKSHRPPRSRRHYRPLDLERCMEHIQAILDGREEPIGYGTLAKQLGCTQHTLLYHFPQECAELSKQIKKYRRQWAEQRIEGIREEVRQAVLALHAQGVYPSHRMVMQQLAHPSLLRHPEANAFRKTLCQELGWEASSP